MSCDECTYCEACKEYAYCNYQGTCTACGYSKPNWEKWILDKLWDCVVWSILISVIVLFAEANWGLASKILSWIGLTN